MNCPCCNEKGKPYQKWFIWSCENGGCPVMTFTDKNLIEAYKEMDIHD